MSIWQPNKRWCVWSEAKREGVFVPSETDCSLFLPVDEGGFYGIGSYFRMGPTAPRWQNVVPIYIDPKKRQRYISTSASQDWIFCWILQDVLRNSKCQPSLLILGNLTGSATEYICLPIFLDPMIVFDRIQLDHSCQFVLHLIELINIPDLRSPEQTLSCYMPKKITQYSRTLWTSNLKKLNILLCLFSLTFY